jgi:hypothetical protein
MDNKDKGNAHIGIGAVAMVFGILEFFSMSPTRPTGRWSLIYGPLFDSFGPIGPALAHVFIGMLFIIFGFILRGKK